ncbi:hypothetical protein HMPREF2978_09375 [Corynebacterium sp. HMSC074C01]|uniref:hypothetical protein n=1 Tax=Corynebacterium sp. HMSC074C01 TaxID=1739482 RepID=UPI0008A1EA2A|nr:hypothetical protein [Corynebacterium sp. HMSC074C01]OFP63635.1 hypothetical protein HMPREF2978_09375 [Corynebacterium sp. HMSC074C01]
MKLYRHMALSWNSFFYALWIVILPVLGMDRGQGWAIGYSLLMALQLYLVQPDFSRYLTFGLSTRVWNGHRRINASLALLLLLVSAPWAFPWWVLIAPTAAWIFCMAKRVEPSRMTASSLIVGSDGDSSTGWFSASPVSQIVLRPQARAWMWAAFGLAIATAISIVVSKLWDTGVGIVGVIVTLIVLPLVTDSIRSSLKDAVAFGLPRGAWAKATLLCTAIPVGLGAVTDVVTLMWTGSLAGFTIVPLAVVAVLVSFAITDKETWPYTAATAGAIAAVLLAWLLKSDIPVWWPLAGMGVLYLVWAAVLPRMAQKANVFTPGLMGWFGVR